MWNVRNGVRSKTIEQEKQFMSPACANILVIDEDPHLSEQLLDALSEYGHRVAQSFDGSCGLLQAISEKFDLILLSVRLPEKCGMEILRALRKSRWTPVILLGEEERQQRIQGFRNGADDFVAKPVCLTELTLRIQAVLRRSRPANDMSALDMELNVRGLYLNRQNLQVLVNEKPIELTPVQFKLLWFLVAHQHEVLQKPYLHTLVLEKSFCRHDRSIDMHLSRIRKKLEEAGLAADRVQTVHGKGYCFI